LVEQARPIEEERDGRSAEAAAMIVEESERDGVDGAAGDISNTEAKEALAKLLSRFSGERGDEGLARIEYPLTGAIRGAEREDSRLSRTSASHDG
jgi:hypothetical protein